MTVRHTIINGLRIKIYTHYFCIGIGIDQITPAYYKYSINEKVSSLKREIYEEKNPLMEQLRNRNKV